MKLPLLFSFVLLALSMVSQASSSYILQIGIDDTMPFRGFDTEGKAVGADVEWIKRILEDAKIPYSIESIPWARSLRMLESGQLDVMISTIKTPERQRFANFSEQIFKYGKNTLFYYRANEQTFSDIESLTDIASAKFTVGVVRGKIYSAEYEDLLQESDFQKVLVPLNSLEQSVAMMDRGRIDAVIGPDIVTQYVFAQACKIDDLVRAFDITPDAESASYIMYSKISVLPKTVKQIDSSMAKLIDAGVRDEIYNSVRHFIDDSHCE